MVDLQAISALSASVLLRAGLDVKIPRPKKVKPKGKGTKPKGSVACSHKMEMANEVAGFAKSQRAAFFCQVVGLDHKAYQVGLMAQVEQYRGFLHASALKTGICPMLQWAFLDGGASI